jgi:hypothetical protein
MNAYHFAIVDETGYIRDYFRSGLASPESLSFAEARKEIKFFKRKYGLLDGCRFRSVTPEEIEQGHITA